jgi:CheY-like chemotaxis protein
MQKPISILIVDDIAHLRQLFRQSLESKFPDAEITDAANLMEARAALKAKSFDAIITDCGFPLDKEAVREQGNRNGPLLIGEIRKGMYGKVNAAAPIAFNSAEITAEKEGAATRHGGNTKSFKKGSLYGGLTVGTASDNFTVDSVATQTTNWLETELSEEKVEQRRKLGEPKAQKQWTLSNLFSFGSSSRNLGR